MPTDGSRFVPTPTPARTPAASTPRRTSWTSSSTRLSEPLIEEQPGCLPGQGRGASGRPPSPGPTRKRRTGPARSRSRPSSNLKVLDPAMGSGHFLVTAVDFLTDYVADLIGSRAPPSPTGCPRTTPTSRPCSTASPPSAPTSCERASRVQLEGATRSQLTDQAIIRRLVLKRCIYGVDKNPLTVELAKVSLWLHSFTVGAPLSFLGPPPALRRLPPRPPHRRRQIGAPAGSMSPCSWRAPCKASKTPPRACMPDRIELSDADVTEVHESQNLFQAVESATAEPARLPRHPRRPPLAHRRPARPPARPARIPSHPNPRRQPHPGLRRDS